MEALSTTRLVLLVIGGLNWGLVGFFKYNLVDEIFGVESALSRIVYGVVGLAALWTLVALVAKWTAKK